MITRRILFTGWGIILLALATSSYSYAQKIEPPWNPPPAYGINFTVPGIDNLPDLHGEIINPDLIVFFAGNQFMVVPELMGAFKSSHPRYKRIYVETLPPGILARQIEEGGLVVGNLRIDLAPDIYTAGKGRFDELQDKGWFDGTSAYARNRLAIMVYKGNPKNIRSLADLGKKDIRVSMPNPAWEGVANRIIEAYRGLDG